MSLILGCKEIIQVHVRADETSSAVILLPYLEFHNISLCTGIIESPVGKQRITILLRPILTAVQTFIQYRNDGYRGMKRLDHQSCANLEDLQVQNQTVVTVSTRPKDGWYF